MKRYYSILLVFTLCMSSCEKYSNVNDILNRENSVESHNAFGVFQTKDDIIDYAQTVVPLLFCSTERTKSIERTVKEVIPFNTTCWMTEVDSDRAQELLDNLYIVNYDNNDGFTIICGDHRTEQVICYSDFGNIDVTGVETKTGIYDQTGQHTIYEILSLLPYYYSNLDQYLIPYPEMSSGDSLDAGGYYYCNPESYYSDWYIISDNVAYTNAAWGQGDPYNYCFETWYDMYSDLTFKPVVGCASIAIGQIMNRFSYPSSALNWGNQSQSMTLDWPYCGSITESRDSTHALSNLLRWIAYSTQSEFYYGVTSTYTDKIKQGLSFFGYSYDNVNGCAEMDAYSLYYIRQSIQNGYPSIVFGAANEYAMGHFWDIEGYRKAARYFLTDWDVYNSNSQYVGRWTCMSERDTQENEYLYCNWGYDGDYNGWFLSRLFSIAYGNFSSNLKEVTGIHHNSY